MPVLSGRLADYLPVSSLFHPCLDGVSEYRVIGRCSKEYLETALGLR